MERTSNTEIFSRLVGNGNDYAVKYCDRGTWYIITGKILSFDGKFVHIQNENEEMILSINAIDGARRVK